MEVTMKDTHRSTMSLKVGLLLAFLLAAGAGCLMSGTEVFSYLIGDLNVTGGAFDSVTIDLTDDDTYNDHKDEIEVIDRVGFTSDVANVSGQDALLSVYFSAESGLTNPAQDATPLFLDVAIPAAGRSISYEESLDLLLNFDQLQEVIKGGVVTFYSTANGTFNLTLNDLTMIVTFTVGL
jgi:hypothetical protein